MSAKTERKAFALLGPRTPLHKWTAANRGWFCRARGCGAKADKPDDTRACLARISPEHWTIIRSVGRNAGNVSGKRRELDTLDRIIALRPLLPWIVVVREATREEDKQGIDIVITTAVGNLFVQVKSGKAQARLWRKKYAATIGARTLLVRWEGDRIAAPTVLAAALQALYARIERREKWAMDKTISTSEHATVALDMLEIVEAANGADWSTREHLRRFANALRARSHNLAHHAFCFRKRAEDFRRMAENGQGRVNRDPERATAQMYDGIAALFEKHQKEVVCGELCGFVHDGIAPWGMTKREPCPCPCHRTMLASSA
jgi:hypothetical protein